MDNILNILNANGIKKVEQISPTEWRITLNNGNITNFHIKGVKK